MFPELLLIVSFKKWPLNILQKADKVTRVSHHLSYLWLNVTVTLVSKQKIWDIHTNYE